MHYEWDPTKAVANSRKHHVRFPDAIGALEDPLAVTREDEHYGETRYATLGTDFSGRLIVVIWTPRGGVIRLISARHATHRERWHYAEGAPDAG